MSRIANIYALALFSQQTKANAKQALSFLNALNQSLQTNPDVFNMLKSPFLRDSQKQAIFKEVLKSTGNLELMGFFGILIGNKRLSKLPEIVRIFETIFDKSSGKTKGTVCSAVELTDGEKEEIKQVIENQISGLVDLQFLVVPEMIGGVEARASGYVFEDSIRSHIQKLSDFIIKGV